MKIAAYARYSTDMQRAASIEDQLRNIRAYCSNQRWPQPIVYEDRAISGSRIDREGYQSLLQAARSKQIDIIICEDVSRLWRSMSEQSRAAEEFEYLGINVIGINDGIDTRNAGWDLLMAIRGAMNAGYRRELAQRTHRGLTGQALDGYSAGGLPYGFTSSFDGKGYKRSINSEQAQVVRWIFSQYVAGESSRAIAIELNKIGTPSPRGGKWAVSSIYPDTKHVGILGNQLYNGRQTWNKSKWIKDPVTGRRLRTLRPESEWVITEHPDLKIIDDDLWNAAISRTLATRARTARQQETSHKTASGGRNPKYLLSGLMRCGECLGAYVVVDRYRYGCATNKDRGDAACSNRIKIARSILEEKLLSGIKSKLLSEESYKLFEEEVRRLLKEQHPDPRQAKQEIIKIQSEVNNIMIAIRQGIITTSTKQALENAEFRLELAQKKLKDIQSWQPTQILPRAREIHRNLVQKLEHIQDIAMAREAIRAIVGGDIELKPENGELWAEMRQGGLAALSQITVVAGAGYGCNLTPLRIKIA